MCTTANVSVYGTCIQTSNAFVFRVVVRVKQLPMRRRLKNSPWHRLTRVTGYHAVFLPSPRTCASKGAYELPGPAWLRLSDWKKVHINKLQLQEEGHHCVEVACSRMSCICTYVGISSCWNTRATAPINAQGNQSNTECVVLESTACRRAWSQSVLGRLGQDTCSVKT